MDDEIKGTRKVIGVPAPDFELKDHLGEVFDLHTEIKKGPLLLAFYPGGPLPVVCSSQFCDYRDYLSEYARFNLRIIGISSDPASRQMQFAQKNNYDFRFLVDSDHRVANLYSCRTKLMFGTVSRAVFIINRKGIVLYRYIEPTALTRRSSPELIQILEDLNSNQLL